jgi:hypothetical protein
MPANPGVDARANIGLMSRKTQSEIPGDRLDSLERHLPRDLAPREQFIRLVEGFGQQTGELLIDLHSVPPSASVAARDRHRSEERTID